MPGLLEVAREHSRVRRRLGQAARGEAASLWSRLKPGKVVESWTGPVARLLVVVTGAQQVSAARADSYLADVLDAQGVKARREGKVSQASFSGVASDGRDLASLLFQPALTALVGLQSGRDPGEVLASGAAQLDTIVRTQVADAGRTADQVALVARPQLTGYVRMLVGSSCSRCIVLAGQHYEWNDGFERHPGDDCIHVPAREDTADDAMTDPKNFFDSLPEAEQDRRFTKAGAEAIRLGADIGQVVNARRGAAGLSVAGEAITTEGSTSAGFAGSRLRGAVRLMPQAILDAADGDRDQAIRDLKRAGYIV